MAPNLPPRGDTAEMATRYCGRCDHLGFVWRRADGTPARRDDPAAVVAARCTHPALYQRRPADPAVSARADDSDRAAAARSIGG